MGNRPIPRLAIGNGFVGRFAGWAEMRPTANGPMRSANIFDQFDPPKPPFDPTKPFSVPVTDPELLAKLNAPDQPESKLVLVATILGPPLFVLIFGWALWWVVRGFRPKEN
jgi:hypothetical protein